MSVVALVVALLALGVAAAAHVRVHRARRSDARVMSRTVERSVRAFTESPDA